MKEVRRNLKRFLKGKLKITLALLVSFLITGRIGYSIEVAAKSHINEQKDINDERYEVTTGDKNYYYGVVAYDRSNFSINSKTIDITNNSSGDGILTEEIPDPEIAALHLEQSTDVKLGNKDTETINMSVNTDKGVATGIAVYNNDKENKLDEGSTLEINGENFRLDVYSKGEGVNDSAYGILVGSKKDKDGDNCEVNIQAENTVINVTSDSDRPYAAQGIAVWGDGTVILNSGNVKIRSANAINVKRNSLVEINANSLDKVIQLDGSIVFECVDPSTPINSTVIVNLTNSNSYLNGNILVTNLGHGHDGDVTGMKLGLSNGASWSTTEEGSFVNELNFNEGIIYNNSGIKKGDRDYSMNIDKMVGTGGTIVMDTTYDEATDSFSTPTFWLGEKGRDTKLTFNYKGITAEDIDTDNIAETERELNQLASKIFMTGEELNSSIHITEGLLDGAIDANLVVDNREIVPLIETNSSNLVVKDIKVNSYSNTVIGLRDLAAINLLTWRQEFSSFSQRMGELRDNQGNSGVWARVYGGEIEQGSNYDNSYQTYQVGYDKAYDYAGGKLFLGYLFSYTDGSTSSDLASGENNSIGAGVYGSWLNNSGHYIDVVAKLSRLHNDYDVYGENRLYNSKGDYTNYGVSLGLEYGKRFVTDSKFFIEPSVRMDLGRVAHRSYTTSSGIRVDQDTLYTALGSVGAKVGYNLEKGNLYARVSGVKEFAGDIDATYTSNTTQKKASVDLEDEWLEFGIGGNYRVAENINLYLDLSKTTEAMVDTNWQANLGFRWEL